MTFSYSNISPQQKKFPTGELSFPNPSSPSQSRNKSRIAESQSFKLQNENNQVINYQTGTVDIPYISPEVLLNDFKNQDEIKLMGNKNKMISIDVPGQQSLIESNRSKRENNTQVNTHFIKILLHISSISLKRKGTRIKII